MKTSNVSLEEKISKRVDFINEGLIPAFRQKHQVEQDFILEQTQHFASFEDSAEEILSTLVEKNLNWSRNLKSLTDNHQRESELQVKVEDYKKAKKIEMTNLDKTIDAIRIAMKEATSKIRPDLIAKINPVPEVLINLFKGLLNLLFDVPPEGFNWETFKNKLLLFEKGEDFQTRLANFSYSGLSQQKVEFIQIFSSDPELQTLVENKKYMDALLDLSEWLTFAVSGIKYTKQREDMQKEYDKVCKDLQMRQALSQNQEKAQVFWETQTNDIREDIEFMNGLLGMIKVIKIDLQGSTEKLKNNTDSFIQMSKEFKQTLELAN